MRRTARAPFALGLVAGVVIAQATAGPSRAQSSPGGLVYEWDYPRCVPSTLHMAEVMQDCLTRVMYPRGIAGDEKPEVDVHAAAVTCRATRSYEANRSLAACVRSLLYERSGLGSRRAGMSGEIAAEACRYATSIPQAEQVEDCMRRLLYTREGLGHQRTEMSVETAAQACQGVAAPVLPPWPYQPLCHPPTGEEAVRFMEDCVKRLMYTRNGLGERRPEVTPEAAAIACQGVLSFLP